jgi:acetyl esterase/lipase
MLIETNLGVNYMRTLRLISVTLTLLFASGVATAQDTPKPATKVVKDLEYGPHERNKLDIYMPEMKGDTKPPLVVWVHGGGWQAGSKELNGPARGLVDQGFAVAAINYRYTNTDPFPAQIHDCKAAVRWLKAHAHEYGYDPKHVGAFGSSAGGHLVALLGTTGGVNDLEGDGGNRDQSSRVDAVVDWFGAHDFLNWDKPGSLVDGNTSAIIGKLLGGPIESQRDAAKRASPITYVSKDCPPMLIVHGDKDNLVPLYQSELFAEALKKKGVDANLHVVKGGGHGIGFRAPEVSKACVDFLNRTLKKKD